MPQNNDDGTSVGSPAPSAGSAREHAIQQLERKRKFHAQAVGSTIAMALLVVIWALSEYHNAGGWPKAGTP